MKPIESAPDSLVHFGETPGNFGQGIFPAGGHKLAVAAHERQLQALRVPREIKSEAALHAKEILVESGEIAIIGAQNFVVAHAQRGLAAVRAVRADRGDVGHFPRARLVAVRAAGERADGADVDAHAALFAVQMILAVRNDHRLRAARAHAERFDVHALVAHAHAAETQNASRRVVINRFRPFLLGLVALFFVEAALVRAIRENHVLQFALAALVAHRDNRADDWRAEIPAWPCALRALAACWCAPPCRAWRPACTRFAAWALFPLRPGTCGRPPAAKGRGNSRTTGLRCPCGARLRSPAFPAGR